MLFAFFLHDCLHLVKLNFSRCLAGEDFLNLLLNALDEGPVRGRRENDWSLRQIHLEMGQNLRRPVLFTSHCSLLTVECSPDTKTVISILQI